MNLHMRHCDMPGSMEPGLSRMAVHPVLARMKKGAVVANSPPKIITIFV